jgi:pyruvate-ferredoxin/flavodoxin oxidoreductase
VSHTSLDLRPGLHRREPDNVVRAVFYGLGADGTVGANKNSIKIIGEETDNYAQGYFVYDSKKSGSMTVSHLRFGPEADPLHVPDPAGQLHRLPPVQLPRALDMLKNAAQGAVFLLNCPFGADKVWDNLPRAMQEQIIEKQAEVLRDRRLPRWRARTGMGTRINTVMQTCFFAISGVLPREEAIEKIKGAIKKTYGKKGETWW